MDEELQVILEAARIAEMSISEWAADVLLRAATPADGPVPKRTPKKVFLGRVAVSSGRIVVADPWELADGRLTADDLRRTAAEDANLGYDRRFNCARAVFARAGTSFYPIHRIGNRIVIDVLPNS